MQIPAGVFTYGGEHLRYTRGEERLEDEGSIYVIRPERPLSVGRMERNINKLIALYDEGYACAQSFLNKV